MIGRLSYKNNIFSHRFIVHLFSAIVISTFVSVRDFSVGVDTQQYIFFFETVRGASSIVWRYEPGFSLLVYLSSFISDNPRVLFFLVSLILTFAFFACFEVVLSYGGERNYARWPFLFLAFLLFLLLSSWYYNSIVNGLRQGLSLSFMYLAILILSSHSKLFFKTAAFVLLSLIAASFHYSVFFIVLSSFLLAFKNKIFFLIWVFLALIYLLGFSPTLVSFMSDVSGVPLYDIVMSYGGEDAKYIGFNVLFFSYTLFWPAFIFFVTKFYSKFCFSDDLVRSVKIYCCLCIPYFMLGFGPFSNRYAVMAWAFLPILQLSFLSSLKLNSRSFISLFLCFVYFSFLHFIFMRLQLGKLVF